MENPVLPEAQPLRPTLNQHGWAQTYLDPFCAEFVDRMKNSADPVGDFGCGYGYTSLKLLEAGATVIANDLSHDQLEELRRSTPPELLGKLTLRPGNCLDLDFPPGCLGGILAARWLHYSPSAEFIRETFQKFHRWLKKDGTVYVTCNTLVNVATPEAYEDYLKKKRSGDEWPGWVTHETITEDLAQVPKVFYGFDVDSLKREVERAGFRVEKCAVYGSLLGNLSTKSWLENDIVGVIAKKTEGN